MIRGKRMLYSPLEDRYRESLQSVREFAYISVSGAVVNLILAVSFFIASFFVVPQA